MSDAALTCNIPADLMRFERPLFHLARQLKEMHPVKIVAIGSSSTAGEGKIQPYPGRLETALRLRFPGRMIDVINRGVGGEEAPEEFRRLERDVVAEAPVLVIWQVGTNAIFHDGYVLSDVAAAIETGLKRLSGLAMDAVLMDLQYAPAIIKPEKLAATERMVALIAEVAQKTGVSLFRRYALMRYWNEDRGIPIDKLIDPNDPDHLHQSEWCTDCVTAALDGSIADAVARAYPVISTS